MDEKKDNVLPMDHADLFQAAYGMINEIQHEGEKYDKNNIPKNHQKYRSNPVFKRLMVNCMPLYKGILLQNVNITNFHILASMLIQKDTKETIIEATNNVTSLLAHEHNVDWSKLEDKKE